MSKALSPHQVLSRLSDNKRQKLEGELADIAGFRKEIMTQHDQINEALADLKVQHQQTLQQGAQASMLMMMDESIREFQQRLVVQQRHLDNLREHEQQVLKQWMLAKQENDVHVKMHAKNEHHAQRQKELRTQQEMDDVFAAKLSRGGAA